MKNIRGNTMTGTCEVFLMMLLGGLLATLIPSSRAIEGVDDKDYMMNILLRHRLSYEELTMMLAAEGIKELPNADESPQEASDRWTEITKMEWERIIGPTVDGSNLYPFVFCSRNKQYYGQQRLQDMYFKLQSNYQSGSIDKFLAPNRGSEGVYTLYNSDNLTCVIVRIPVSLAIEMASDDHVGFDNPKSPTSLSRSQPMYVVQPHISLFKITEGSIDRLVDVFGTNSTWAEKSAHTETLLPKFNLVFCEGVVTDDMAGVIEDDIASQNGALLKEILANQTVEGGLYSFELVYDQFFSKSTEAMDFYYQYQSLGSGKGRKEFWTEVLQQTAKGVCNALIETATFDFDRANEVLSITVPKKPNNPTYSNAQVFLNDVVTKFCGIAVLVGISQVDLVCSIDVAVEVETGNVQSSWISQSGVRDTFPWFDQGITGKGQVVSVSDTGIDLGNCYFYDSSGTVFDTTRRAGDVDTSRRKVIQYYNFVDNTDYPSGHGTHVAGTVAGNKAVDGQVETNGMATGVAKEAKLAFYDIGHADGSLSIPFPPNDLFNKASAASAFIHSASWGSESNAYGSNARAFDDYVYNNPEFLIVVAAGNSGQRGQFNSVGDPATAKNIISVGACNSESPDLQDGELGSDYVADFSSRGPSQDGRTLPHVINVGKWVTSANSGGFCDPGRYPEAGLQADGVLSLQGTSMATPGVSGTAALIRQYFVEGWYPDGVKNETASHTPTAALIKAVLMNGAQPLLGVDNGGFLGGGPEESKMYDNIQNMGRISLPDSLYIPGYTNVKTIIYDRETVFQGETKIYTATIDQVNGCDLPDVSITLVWTDPPGAQGCKQCLIHDIDLTVESNLFPGQIFYPNGLNTADRVNNAERVRRAATDQEIFTIKVTGHNVIYGQQQFALVVSGCFGGVSNTLDTSANRAAENGTSTARIVIGIVGVIAAAAIIGGIVYWFIKAREAREASYEQQGIGNRADFY